MIPNKMKCITDDMPLRTVSIRPWFCQTQHVRYNVLVEYMLATLWQHWKCTIPIKGFSVLSFHPCCTKSMGNSACRLSKVSVRGQQRYVWRVVHRVIRHKKRKVFEVHHQPQEIPSRSLERAWYVTWARSIMRPLTLSCIISDILLSSNPESSSVLISKFSCR